MAVKPLKKFVTVAYVCEVQADMQEGIDSLAVKIAEPIALLWQTRKAR